MLKIATLATLLALGTAASAEKAGTVTGVLMLDEHATDLRHAYASEVNDLPELLPPGSPATHIKINFADRELPPVSRSYRMVNSLGRQDRRRGLVLDIAPAGARVLRAETVGNLPGQPQFFLDFGGETEPPALIEGLVLPRGWISARVVTTRTQEIFILDAPGHVPKTWGVNVTFDVPVSPAPPLVATLEGDAARGSGPVQALRAYFDALVAGDVATARESFAPRHPALAYVTPDDLYMLKGMVLQLLPDAGALLALPIKVYLCEGSAAVLIQRDYGRAPYPMTIDGGRWKLDL